ncbi:MAG: HTTM domain-containing protein [Saprospirales bacterium]|nr:MAG: HTTM domain-containing protein [Saprospirales bacterium]
MQRKYYAINKRNLGVDNSSRKRLDRILFKEESNAPIEIFRVAFGALMLAEAWGALATGWVRRVFVDVNYTFTFFGFEWTQVLLGTPMQVLFILMGVFAIGVMLGYKYRFSILMLAILWSISYLMQKSHYNNHYYLVMLVSWLFVFFPMGRRFSIDARQNSDLYQTVIPAWPRLLLIVLIAIVYFFASINKIYPDWLQAMPLKIWMGSKSDIPILGPFLQREWVPYSMAYSGIAYDLLVVPMLLWKRTRWLAIAASLGFHLFNSIVFQIGIFPYFALAFSLFFFPTQRIEKLVSRGREVPTISKPIGASYRKFVKIGFMGFLTAMLILPVRHHFIPDDVLWTEAGHRLSWRMMLRTKAGIATFYVETDQQQRQMISMRDRLAKHQVNNVATKPDMMYTFARKLQTEFKEKGHSNVKVFVDARVSVNGRPYQQFTDRESDLLATRWNYFGNQHWVLPRPW